MIVGTCTACGTESPIEPEGQTGLVTFVCGHCEATARDLPHEAKDAAA